MSDSGPDSPIRSRLRHLRAKADQRSADFIEITERLGFLQGSQASISRVDRVAGDVDASKRRLDPIDLPR